MKKEKLIQVKVTNIMYCLLKSKSEKEGKKITEKIRELIDKEIKDTYHIVK